MVIIPTEKRINWQRPPIALLSIIILNVLVFWLYQGLDNNRMDRALALYNQYQLLDAELPAYQQYLKNNDREAIPEDDQYIAYYVLSDPEFTAHLKTHAKLTVVTNNYQHWLEKRTEVNKLWDTVSYQRFGLISADITLFSLISYQFLHGDWMHLIGNMVFLLFVGFAAEAALGSLRFSAYYLISGIGAGLFYVLVDFGSSFTTLIGASGSVSGVMAMYVALFGLRKIKFFYWIFVFAGYFRAAAVIILPLYILKEVYFYFTDEGSSIAYTAHIGGFICGALLVLITLRLSKKSIDEDYLDGNEVPVDLYLIELNELYKKMGQCDFSGAWKALSVLTKNHGRNSELLEIELNLIKAINRKKLAPFLIRNFGKTLSNPKLIKTQYDYWDTMTLEQKSTLTFFQKNQFAIDLLVINQIVTAKEIYLDLKENSDNQHQEVAILARKIAVYYQNNGQTDAANSFDQQARSLMQDTQLGNT